MNKVILFTPVGGTDPISSTNCHDGSMLHICRMYKPDKVIMYMSKEMLDYQELDDRYLYCLTRLAKLQNREMEYEIIERRNLTRVHEFDYFYEDFRQIIERVYEQMDETDTLLLNVSSGTPAMKSGLAVLKTIGEFPATLIQVTTPEKKINEHIHEGYDVKILWELNEDNEPEPENRCSEIQCPTLSKLKQEEIIKKHIKVYDYQAALDVADTMSERDTSKYRELLYLASRRVLLDFSEVDKKIRETGFKCLPVINSSERKYFEYALNVDLRIRKREYVDFIRSITPLIVDLFELVLKKQCRLKFEDFCEVKKRNGTYQRRWSENKLHGTKVESILKEHYSNFKAGDIYSDHLRILIIELCEDVYLKGLVNDLRDVEKNIRNVAAHEIISVTEEKIKELTGFSGEQIMNKIKELFRYTSISIKKEYWDSYDEMNAKILEKIG